MRHRGVVRSRGERARSVRRTASLRGTGLPGGRAAQAAREAEEVADERAGAGLATDCLALDNDGVQTFRGAADGCCEPAWSRSDDREIARAILEFRCSKRIGELGVGRILQHPAVEHHDGGQAVSIDAGLLEYLAAGFGVDVVPPVRDAVAFEQVGEHMPACRWLWAENAHELEAGTVCTGPVRQELTDYRIEMDLRR